MNGKSGKAAAILVLLILISHIPSVKADEAPDPNFITSLSAQGKTLNSFLESVNVTMFVDTREADGVGTYVIRNPSDRWENFSVIFDPGADTYGMEVDLEGDEPDIENVWIENFYGERWDVYGIKFNVSVPPNGTVTNTVTWKYHVDQDSHKYWSYRTLRKVQYLIIGMLGWSQPISTIDVEFIMVTEEYRKSDVVSSEFRTMLDDEGRKVYTYHAENFSSDRLLLEVVFIQGGHFKPSLIGFIQICPLVIFFFGTLGFAYYLHQREMKRKKREK